MQHPPSPTHPPTRHRRTARPLTCPKRARALALALADESRRHWHQRAREVGKRQRVHLAARLLLNLQPPRSADRPRRERLSLTRRRLDLWKGPKGAEGEGEVLRWLANRSL
eukprot:279297-Chlamydomonas_euryale.AAC.12